MHRKCLFIFSYKKNAIILREVLSHRGIEAFAHFNSSLKMLRAFELLKPRECTLNKRTHIHTYTKKSPLVLVFGSNTEACFVHVQKTSHAWAHMYRRDKNVWKNCPSSIHILRIMPLCQTMLFFYFVSPAVSPGCTIVLVTVEQYIFLQCLHRSQYTPDFWECHNCLCYCIVLAFLLDCLWKVFFFLGGSTISN